MDLLTYTLPSEVTAFSTKRMGGMSEGPYASFNINGYCGDCAAHVAANRRQLCEYLGVDTDRLIMPHQTHGAEILSVDADFLSLPSAERATLLEGVDAVVTDEHLVCIGVSTADCIPVLLYDPCRKVVAAVHAGWRGSRLRIVERTLQFMKSRYAVRPEDVYAVIGPGISQDAFEVGNEVYEAFKAAGFDMTTLAARYPAANGGTKWHLDLWTCNRSQLQTCGVSDERILQAGICTFAHPDEFFSARRLGVQSGRIFNGILLR